jgi:hypothetical protein
MAIRIEHQPSGTAVGMAAYVAGQGRARQRKQKDILDILEKQQQRSGNIYRNANGRGIGGQQIAQPEGTWIDPYDSPFLTGEEKAKIAAQRHANQRALRMGGQVLHPEVEMQFRPAPTKEQLEQQRFERGVQYEDAIHQRNRTETANDLVAKQTFDLTKSRFEDLKKQFDAIDPGDPTAWADQERGKEYYEKKHNLLIGKKDQDGQKKLTPLQYYSQGIKDIGSFLEGHQSTHLKPLEERPNYESVTKSGRLIRRKMDGSSEDLGPAPDSMLSPEQIEARNAERQRRLVKDESGRVTGQYRQDRYGEYIDPFSAAKSSDAKESDKYWDEHRKWMQTLSPPGGIDKNNYKEVSDLAHKIMEERGMQKPQSSQAEPNEAATNTPTGENKSGPAKVIIGENGQPILSDEEVSIQDLRNAADNMTSVWTKDSFGDAQSEIDIMKAQDQRSPIRPWSEEKNDYPTGTTAKPQSRAEFDSLPPGTPYELPDGRSGVK